VPDRAANQAWFAGFQWISLEADMNALARVLVLLGLLLLAWATPASARQSTEWLVVPSGANLLQSAYWEGYASAVATDGIVTIAPVDEDTPAVLRYGPRLRVEGDFGLIVSLQSLSHDLGAISLVDAVGEDQQQWVGMRRLEFGIQDGAVVVGIFDGSGPDPVDWYTFDSDVPLGPVTIDVRRIAGEFAVAVSGVEQLRFADPGVFQTGWVLLATRVQGDNQLTLHELSVEAPRSRLAGAHVERCAPARLLVAGSDASNIDTGLWFLSPDEGTLRRVEASTNQTSFLVAVSPDVRWAAYYQRSNQAPPDRFIVDSWVIDLATDERFRLVERSTPLGWIDNSSAIVLADRPSLMVMVPGGELQPTAGVLTTGDAMKAIDSPDGRLRAVVTNGIMGSVTGVDIVDRNTAERLMTIPTGRGAITLAWSPDSTRLAFTSSQGGQNALLWRLQIATIVDRKVFSPEVTGDLQIHSVVWAPPLPGCK
jgi:hypothetical protein